MAAGGAGHRNDRATRHEAARPAAPEPGSTDEAARPAAPEPGSTDGAEQWAKIGGSGLNQTPSSRPARARMKHCQVTTMQTT